MNLFQKIGTIFAFVCFGTALADQQSTSQQPTTAAQQTAPSFIEQFRKTVGFLRVT